MGRTKSLTQLQAVILGLLQATEWMYGLELIKESGGILKRGTIYVLLDRLEDDGFIRSKKREPKPGEQGPARRVYKLTGSGARALDEYRLRAGAINGLLGLEG